MNSNKLSCGPELAKANLESRSNSPLKIDELFKACDSQGKGRIGPQDFSQLCNKFGISSEDAGVIFVDLDHDGDGQIDFEDFSYGFSDFLNPGSRRGSFQIVLSDEEGDAAKQLLEMEKKHASAKVAWKHFVRSVGPTNLRPFIIQKEGNGAKLYDILEELHKDKSIHESSPSIEKTLTTLIFDVQVLHEEYKSLESSFQREREIHAAQLASLGEELDSQLAKAEAKARVEARNEAQKQMDSERKKIALEMENKLAELSTQMRTFEKVEEWLLHEEARVKKLESLNGPKTLLDAETESENRKLRSALMDTQMKASFLQTQLTIKRNEYLDLCQELRSEKLAASEYRNQCDKMQGHLSVLSATNRVLSDTNDCLSSSSASNRMSLNDEQGDCSKFQQISLDSPEMVKYPMFFGEPRSFGTNNENPAYGFLETDKDSGRGTLLDELKAEGEFSPLPSGIWSAGSPVNCRNIDNAPYYDVLGSHNQLKSGRSSGLWSDPSLYGDNTIPQRTFKVILAGDAAVGKTSFIERACNGHFVTHLSSTIGVDFRVKTIEVDGFWITLQLWDTAGQERFRSLTKSYFRRADGVILMYDVTSERTFASMRHWMQNVEEGAGRTIPVVLCGNKVDLREPSSMRQAFVSQEDGLKLSKQFEALFMETSPKTNKNILDTLILLAREMRCVEDAEMRNSLQLTKTDMNKSRRCCSLS